MSQSALPPPDTGAGRSLPDLSGLLPQRSAGLKLILVCALALLMAIPALFIYGIVHERTTGQIEARFWLCLSSARPTHSARP